MLVTPSLELMLRLSRLVSPCKTLMSERLQSTRLSVTRFVSPAKGEIFESCWFDPRTSSLSFVNPARGEMSVMVFIARLRYVRFVKHSNPVKFEMLCLMPLNEVTDSATVPEIGPDKTPVVARIRTNRFESGMLMSDPHGSYPVPLNDAVSEAVWRPLLYPTVNVPLSAPSTVGANRTEISQYALGAREPQVPVIVKLLSSVFRETLVAVVSREIFVIRKVVAALVLPTRIEPKFLDEGEMLSDASSAP